MRRSALVVMAIAAVSLAFGLSMPSAQKIGGARPAPSLSRAGAPATGDPVFIGPGFGGFGTRPVRFLGATTARFPAGVGALIASRACNEELPTSRLCERGEILRAFPPPAPDSEMLVAPSFSANPIPVCMNMNGAPRCMPSPALKPAACCGYHTSRIGSLTLTPADDQAFTTCADTFVLTATAFDVSGAPMPGETIVFDSMFLPGSTPLVFTPASGTSAGDGTVSTTVSIEASLCANHCTGTQFSCGFTVQARDQYGSIWSNVVLLNDDIP